MVPDMLDLSAKVLPAEPLLGWINRHKLRLEAQGSAWEQWCRDKGVSSTRVKRNVLPGTLISYELADYVLTHARMRPEDIY